MWRLEFSSSPALSSKYCLHFQTELGDFYEFFSPSISLSLTPILKSLIHFHAYLVDPLSLWITRENILCEERSARISFFQGEKLKCHLTRCLNSAPRAKALKYPLFIIT